MCHTVFVFLFLTMHDLQSLSKQGSDQTHRNVDKEINQWKVCLVCLGYSHVVRAAAFQENSIPVNRMDSKALCVEIVSQAIMAAAQVVN